MNSSKAFTKLWLISVPVAVSAIFLAPQVLAQPVHADSQVSIQATPVKTTTGDATGYDFTASNHHSQASIEQGTLGDGGNNTFTKADINESGSTSKVHYLRMPMTIPENGAAAWLAFAKKEAEADYSATGRSQNIVQLAATPQIDSFTIGQAAFPRVDTVDVSSYQNTMTQANYNTLKASGVKAFIVKASEGTTYTNPDASTQLTQAQNAGMKIAAYHYVHFSSTTTAAAEANYFAAVLNKLGVPKGSPVVADLESADVGGNVGSALNTFWSTLSSRGYTNHVLYTGKYYSWSNDAIGTVGQARTWIAQYPYQPRANNLLNTTYGAWQFSSQAKIAGYSSTLDASIDYTGLFTGSTVAPAPHGYDKVTSTRAINLPGTVDQSIRQDGFYSAPYNTDSMTTIENHNAKLFNGQTVQILQEATTSRSASAGNTFYQIRFVNGKTYWTDSRAIKVHSFYQESNTKNVNYKAKIAQAGRNDGLYPDGPYYTKLSNIFENSNAPRFNGQTVSVSQETTTPTGTYVRVTLNNGQVEWIDKKGITTDTYDKVTSSTQLNQVGRIEQAGRADGLYSAPYNTNAATVTPNSNAKLFNGQGVQILAKETTNRAGGHNTFYKLRLRNGDIHWIDADGVKLVSVNHVTSTQALNVQGRINQAGRSDGLYSAPWNTDYLSIDENHNAPAFNGKTVQVKAEATTDRSASAGNHFYQIKLSDGRLYWIDARGVKLN